ncbi:MAG: tRNA (adenosine(37)-N6)-threonylcarbamoyltransferase complex transferase subunit TsaD [Metamycoplasmataceae bacterium]
MIILGIESTHDDTSIAILDNDIVLHNLKISQIDIHKKYGGTVPEIASREHVNNFFILIEELKKIFDLKKVDKIAYSSEPGLIGSLQIGYLVAHAMSNILHKELIKINHLHGHIFSSVIKKTSNEKKEIKYPSLALILSGGHSQIYLLKNNKEIEVISSTVDDAVGEVFDKVSRVLDLGFPGGPIIDKIFENNSFDDLIPFSKPKKINEINFSFSGIKTQVTNYVNNHKNIDKNLVAYSFQKTVIDYIIEIFEAAIKLYKPNSIILAGGVSANSYLRKKFQKLHNNILIPEKEFSTDNGAMISCAAFYQKIKK